jgi:hypothetical protein
MSSVNLAGNRRNSFENADAISIGVPLAAFDSLPDLSRSKGAVSWQAIRGQWLSLSRGPFVEYEEHTQHDAGEAEEVIPAKFFAEVDESENAEDCQGDGLLNHFKLIAGEAFFVAQAVGGNLKTVFEKRDEPTD